MYLINNNQDKFEHSKFLLAIFPIPFPFFFDPS
jgi:hypothetical protein